MFGMLFGLARGGLIVLVLVLLAGLTTLPRDPLWRNAMLSSPLEAFAMHVKVWLPGDWSRRIKYD
jgi:membrane protein required for colicin V production